MATEKKKNKEIEEKASLKTEKKESKVSVAEKKKEIKEKNTPNKNTKTQREDTEKKESGAKKANTTKKLENTKNNEKDNDEENIKGEEKQEVGAESLIKPEEELSVEKLAKVKDEIKEEKNKRKNKAKDIPVTEYIMDLKTFSIFAVIIAVITFEQAYKKDDGSLAIHGIEIVAIAIETLILLNLYSVKSEYFFMTLMGITIAMIAYYFIKCIIIAIKNKR